MPEREIVNTTSFNQDAELPFELRLKDFEIAMQDVYGFFYDVNLLFDRKGLPRLDDELRPAIMSGMLSDMLTASLAKHARALTQNRHLNGHPDLVVNGRYPTTPSRQAAAGSRSRRPERPAAPWTRMARATSGCASSCMESTAKPNLPASAGRCGSRKCTSPRSRRRISVGTNGASLARGPQPWTAKASRSSAQTGSIGRSDARLAIVSAAIPT